MTAKMYKQKLEARKTCARCFKGKCADCITETCYCSYGSHPRRYMERLRGQHDAITGGWRCDCRTHGSSPWSNLRPQTQSICKKCGVYRPLAKDRKD